MTAFIPTAIIGLVFYPLIKSYLLNNLPVTISALFIGGVVILLVPRIKFKTKNANYLTYLKIGLFQSISIIPGTSRALMSILGGLFSGLNLKESIKFSFFLALPTIASATILDLLKSRHEIINNLQFTPHFLIGFLISFLTAKLTINFFLKHTEQKGLTPFGYYRMVLAVLIFLILI